jgi:hypothetical protein
LIVASWLEALRAASSAVAMIDAAGSFFLRTASHSWNSPARSFHATVAAALCATNAKTLRSSGKRFDSVVSHHESRGTLGLLPVVVDVEAFGRELIQASTSSLRQPIALAESRRTNRTK